MVDNMSFGDFLKARRRGVILGALHVAYKAGPGQTVAPDLLYTYLAHIGLKPTLAAVHRDLEWMAERGLIALDRIDGAVFGKITQHGIEAATRRIMIAGVDVAEVED